MTTYQLNMAGTVGFEPTNAEIKTQSLTTWRRPKSLFCKSPITTCDAKMID